MKTLLISSILLTSLVLAGCSDKEATTSVVETSITQQQTISENEEHGHDSEGNNVPKDDTNNIDGVGYNNTVGMDHAIITSEEQFIAEMIPHHQEAVNTAKVIVSKGENTTLKKIAQAIVDGQSSEITTLQGWFSSWYPSSAYITTYQNMMRPLDKLSGHDLEDQFMEDMIKHHEGAIQMAQQVLDISQRSEIVQFANDVINAQSSEIIEFKKLLDTKDRH